MGGYRPLRGGLLESELPPRQVRAALGWFAGFDRLLAYDAGLDDVADLDGASPDEGNAWRADVGSWDRSGGLIRSMSAPSSGPRAATIDAGTENVVVGTDLVSSFTDTSARTYALVLRLVDASNFLLVYVESNAQGAGVGLSLAKVEAGAETSLASGSTPRWGQGAPTRVHARVFGGLLGVSIDGVSVLEHQFSSGDQSTFGAATRHGLGGRLLQTSHSAQFRNFAMWDGNAE